VFFVSGVSGSGVGGAGFCVGGWGDEVFNFGFGLGFGFVFWP